MPFARGPVLIYVGRGRYRTVGPSEYAGATDILCIPADFQTDLASIPRIFWSLLPPSGVYERAAVLHDYGCVSLLDGSCTLSPRDVDGLFRRVIREEQELDKFRGPLRTAKDFAVRWVLWWGVRLGALASAHRRGGWLADAPTVAAITAALLAASSATLWVTDGAVHALFDWTKRSLTP